MREDSPPGARWKRYTLVLAVGAATLLLQAGCIVLPIPHKVVEHGAIRGRVVDDESDHPIPGVQVFVGDKDGDPDATTDSEGRFAIAVREEWSWFYFLPLVPLDVFVPFDRVTFVDSHAVPTLHGTWRRYREISVEVRSKRPTPMDAAWVNRELEDDLGTVRMKLIEPLPRP